MSRNSASIRYRNTLDFARFTLRTNYCFHSRENFDRVVILFLRLFEFGRRRRRRRRRRRLVSNVPTPGRAELLPCRPTGVTRAFRIQQVCRQKTRAALVREQENFSPIFDYFSIPILDIISYRNLIRSACYFRTGYKKYRIIPDR